MRSLDGWNLRYAALAVALAALPLVATLFVCWLAWRRQRTAVAARGPRGPAARDDGVAEEGAGTGTVWLLLVRRRGGDLTLWGVARSYGAASALARRTLGPAGDDWTWLAHPVPLDALLS